MFSSITLPTEPVFYLAGYFAVGLVSLTKSAFGGGLGLIGIPILALVMSPIEAAIILGPMFSIMDIFAVGAFRNESWSKADVLWLWPGVLVGITIGALFFVYLDPDLVSATIGIVTLIFCIHYYYRSRLKISQGMPVNPPLALAAGAASGFTSFIAHGGGPPAVAYMLRRGLDKTVYAGSLIIFFTLGNLIKGVPYVFIALHYEGLIWKMLVLVPIIPFAVWLGRILHKRLPQNTLYFWCYLFLTVAGLNLTITSVLSLLN